MKTIEMPEYDNNFEIEKLQNEEMKEISNIIEEILSYSEIKKIKLRSYYDSALRFLMDDIRFCYRKFRLIAFNECEFYGCADQISIMNLAMISLMTDIEYKNPIDITIAKEDTHFKITYEVIVKNECITDYQIAKRKFADIYEKELYVACICTQSENSYHISIENGVLRAEAVIYPQIAIDKELAFQAFGDNEKSLITKYLDILFKSIEGEGIEEEE